MGGAVDNEVMLSLEEFGILCFTNSHNLGDEVNNHMEVVLASRESYLWVPVISYLLKKTELRMEDIRVFIEVSLNALVTKNREQWNNRALSVEGVLSELDATLFYTTRLRFEDPVLEHLSLFGSSIDEMTRRLEKHNLIENHHIGMLDKTPCVMLGILPIRLTRRTQIGEEVYLKFSNTFRKLELQKEVEGSVYELHYKFHSLWEYFKANIFSMEAANDSPYGKKRNAFKP